MKTGDKIVYGSNGVMMIVDIRDETVGESIHKYYVLEKIGDNSSSKTFVPIDNKRLVESMRPLLTREEVLDIISRIKTIPKTRWQNDSRKRSEDFRAIIESGDREGMIALIKAVYENGVKRKEEGKKNYLADENLMRRAEKLIYAEFAEVLGIGEDEVQDFIEQNA